MRGLVIILFGLALLAGGFFNIQNDFYGFACCFLGGSLVGVGISKVINDK